MRNARNTSLGEPELRFEDNIEMNLPRIGHEIVVRIHLIRDRNKWPVLVNTVMNLCLP